MDSSKINFDMNECTFSFRGHKAAEKYRDWRHVDMPRMWSIVKERDGNPDTPSRKTPRQERFVYKTCRPRRVINSLWKCLVSCHLCLLLPLYLQGLQNRCQHQQGDLDPEVPRVAVAVPDPIVPVVAGADPEVPVEADPKSSGSSRSRSSSRSISVYSNPTEGSDMQLEQADVVKKPEPEVTDGYLGSLATNQECFQLSVSEEKTIQSVSRPSGKIVLMY